MYPKGSILIENPVAIVDKNAEEHCVMDVAQAFVDFLHSKEAKGYYTETGFLRSTDPKKAAEGDPANGFPEIQDLFTVEDLGGWDALDREAVRRQRHRDPGDRQRMSGAIAPAIERTQRPAARHGWPRGCATWPSVARPWSTSACLSSCPWQPSSRRGSATVRRVPEGDVGPGAVDAVWLTLWTRPRPR